MNRRFLKFAAAALAVCLAVPAAAGAAPVQRSGGTDMIRVGLASSYVHNATGELEAAHLQNEDGYGAGYRFGYYDDDLNFVELGYTSTKDKQVAVLKTTNLYYGYSSTLGKNTYSSSIHSDIVVGCYHVLIEDGIRDYETAKAAANDYKDGFVAWIDGGYQVRAGSFETKEDAERYGERGEIVGTSSYGLNVVKTGTSEILFQYDEGAGGKLAIQPGADTTGETRTWFSGFHYRGGFEYHRRTGGNITVVNVLDLEDYVNGVVCYEMGREWPLEALKAQALCARTYALKTMRSGSHNKYGFDICNSTYCQVYRGMGNASGNYGPSSTSMRAVEETAGLVIEYNGKLAETPYSSCFGGASEDAHNVWGTDTTTSHPYLRGVEDPYESYVDSINPKSHWTVSYSASELDSRLHGYGYGGNATLDSLQLNYSQLGNVIEVVVHWDNGQTNSFRPDGGKSIRSVFGVDSIRFTVNGKTVNSSAKGARSSNTGEGYMVNGSFTDRLDDMYTISGDGVISGFKNGSYAISGSGFVTPVEDLQNGGNSGGDGNNQGGGTVTVTGQSYIFEGSGFGHQLGMSQFGANAMAKQGFHCDEIVEFYYPGVRVTHY